MAGHHHVTHVEDPGGVGLPKILKYASYAFAFIGLFFLVDLLMGKTTSVETSGGLEATSLRGYLALLHAYFFVFVLSLGGLVFTAIQYCASARWSIAVRRIAEGFVIFLPISFVLFLIIAIFGYETLYGLESDVRAAIGKDGIYHPANGNDLIQKSAFLSQLGVLVKGCVSYGIWGFFGWKIISNSYKQDKSKDPELYKKNVKYSIIFLILFMYTFSLHAIDMLQALEAKWFSTMFGVYIFAGLFLSTMCLIAVIAIVMRKHDAVSAAIQKRHLFDLGTWIMAFSCFMCYVGFSQYMLIWYANIPEETFYIIDRSNNGWQFIFGLLPLLKWIVPFAFLMPQGFRSHPGVLIPVALAVFVGNWLDMYWIIYPTFYPIHADSPIGFGELGTLLFVVGLFGIALDFIYKRQSVLPMGDPYLKTSVEGSYL